MKKLLLFAVITFGGFASYAQVVCAGVSPAAIQGNYDYGVQAACGQWPGETDDGTWGAWNGGLDFNIPGDHIQGELMLVEDGTPGLNPQGNPISQEGCDSLINNLTGKIAVVYRNTCWFSSKIYYAEQAGAIGVVIINREEGVINMLGNTDPVNGPFGSDCHIPAVFLSYIDGQLLVNEMNNGPVEMFIGNKLGAFNDDIGAVKGEFMIAPYGINHVDLFDGFDLGVQVYNYGLNDLPNAKLYATIDGPNGNVYSDSVDIPLNSGDTAFVFPGNTTELPAFDLGGVGNYDVGDYTLTYTIDAGAPDEFPFDNVYVAEFSVDEELISPARANGSGMPVSNSNPSNSTTEYQSCFMIQEPNFNNFYTDGAYITPHTDTSQNTLAGSEIFVNIYQWDDGWTDLNDPNYAFDPATNDAFQNLNLLAFGTHYPGSDNEVDQPAFVFWNTLIPLQANVRYLVCAQTFESTTISFGYDNALDYGANYSIYAQPVSPVHVDGMWYAAGWNGVSAPSIAVHQGFIGLDEANVLKGSAFPNPSNSKVTISVNASGDAQLRVVDVTGKVVFDAPIVLENGQTKVDISSFDAGVYVFNVTTANDKTAQFNVVKQ